ncbi:MAG TPA: hypothetical protein VNC50_17375, partial [Planctomycetia bacterium]|nr:hypothetical protein [Planctomycetia bacterium]
MEKAATTLKTRVAALRERHRELRRNGAGGLELAHSFADAAADVVREAWTAALTAECVSEKEIAAGVALVAVGGFGRRELCPFSDIDLVIVHSPRSDDRLPAVVKRAVREIWDAGLALGQNVATVKQLLTQAKTDVTLATGLFSARPIWGADKLASDLSEQFRKSVVNGGRAKLEQQLDASMTEEFQRFGATAHLVEPNVKRSAGGLRHVQYIHWSGLLRGVG